LSRFYEAMKRALEQQAEPREGQEAASALPVESTPQADLTQGCRAPVELLEAGTHRGPTPFPGPPTIEGRAG